MISSETYPKMAPMELILVHRHRILLKARQGIYHDL